MGYTHHWTYPPGDPGYAAAWPALITDTHAIARRAADARIALAGPMGFAQPVISLTHGIGLNGRASTGQAFESFVLQPPDPTREPGDVVHDFCKTASRPYDVAVTTILLRFATTLPAVFTLSSDGTWDSHWTPARRLYADVFGEPPATDPFTHPDH